MEKPITLTEFAVIQEATTRFAACRIADEIMRQNVLADALWMGYAPPTKWERRKARIREFFGRFKLAYRALRGDDLTFED